MKASLLSAIAFLFLGFAASAQQDSSGNGMGMSNSMDNNGKGGKIGRITVAAFNSVNAKGNKMVSAIKPTSSPLSAADQQLLLQVAAGGQRQLAISQAVIDKVTDPQVKLLAASEIEEQTGIAAKLQEIATAKNFTLPSAPPDSVQQLVSGASSLSGDEINNFYLTQGGINGHVLLQKTMTKVNTTAKDVTLRKLSLATLPVIKVHLAVSREVKSMMGSGMSNASR